MTANLAMFVLFVKMLLLGFPIYPYPYCTGLLSVVILYVSLEKNLTSIMATERKGSYLNRTLKLCTLLKLAAV
jgi:hypothetical protein